MLLHQPDRPLPFLLAVILSLRHVVPAIPLSKACTPAGTIRVHAERNLRIRRQHPLRAPQAARRQAGQPKQLPLIAKLLATKDLDAPLYPADGRPDYNTGQFIHENYGHWLHGSGDEVPAARPAR